MLKDSKQREEATDPSQSFIVQAPAGSGKTELLTQRYLRLLAEVNNPEEIIALTFTRKAASEMRERIVHALNQAHAEIKADSAFKLQTQAYAKKALAHHQQLGRSLSQQTSRLKIMTIDALCQMISHAISLQEKDIPFAKITDKPALLYQEAACNALDYAAHQEDLQQVLKKLLKHLDNRQDQLVNLLGELLAKRDQWLHFLYQAREQTRAQFEVMLQIIEHHELAYFKTMIPQDCQEELCLLSRQLAEIEANPLSPRLSLQNWLTYDALDRKSASSLANLLLTTQGCLRKKFDHHVGLKRGACDDKLYLDLKERSASLFAKLADVPNLAETLLKIKMLPATSYEETQWDILKALFSFLPILLAHLKLCFLNDNAIDFIEMAHQALFALGDADSPTDLALYLDNRICHLLIDEFQDTSITQFQLLSKLVYGWQEGDGRTLFVVGDPMQSIYRFRQAEVGLFLKAKQQGIGGLRLKSLTLESNFRSTPTLVNWANQTFRKVFPPLDNIEAGAVCFHPATAVSPSDEQSLIKAYQLPNAAEEAAAIANLVYNALQEAPQDDIAILVRSRAQLREITKKLRRKQIAFEGTEIEFLAKKSHLRDLMSLTEVLLMPANRLAWLALLRSPFCGLGLAELYVIANFAKTKSIYYALSQLDVLALNEDSRKRLQFVYAILHQAILTRHQLPLADWIAATFKALHGEKIFSLDEQAEINSFWTEIRRFTDQGNYLDLEQFRLEFNKLYAKHTIPSRLKVMTIHKSKGLEFDTVILPGLSLKPKTTTSPLIRSLKLPQACGEDLLLVSPIKASYRKQCLVYDYIERLDAEKSHYELQRLLYVAATRAKKRLYLFDNSEHQMKNSFRYLLSQQEFLISPVHQETSQTKSEPFTIYRLAAHYYATPLLLKPESNKGLPISTPTTARELGIVAHELLQWICNHHPTSLSLLPWSMVCTRLKMQGFVDKALDEALATLNKQMEQLFADPLGLWLISPKKDEVNEYELLINRQGEAKTYIIDRSFLEKDQRWIIDFKTGQDDEKSQTHHRQQVEEYASFFKEMENLPIVCGLYYLATNRWVSWDYKIRATLGVQNC